MNYLTKTILCKIKKERKKWVAIALCSATCIKPQNRETSTAKTKVKCERTQKYHKKRNDIQENNKYMNINSN